MQEGLRGIIRRANDEIGQRHSCCYILTGLLKNLKELEKEILAEEQIYYDEYGETPIVIFCDKILGPEASK